MSRAEEIEPAGYGALLEDIKSQVRTARVHAARKVNTELILLYWKIGKLIRARQSEEGWGTRVIARLADDLRTEFPGMRGLSQRNLVYMRTLATEYPDPIAQHPAAQLPWGHILVLLDRLPDPRVRDWYAGQAAHHGWSRATLVHHISSERHLRVGAAPNNFPTTLPAHESDLAHEILQDPYNLDFLGLDAGYSERDLEDALIGRLTHFLTELGGGFSFVGRQYKLTVGNSDFYLDLLFFHLGLRRFVVFELKIGHAEPEHIGKLNFYVNAVDDLLRKPEHGDGTTIGILLAADRDDIVVEYALRGLDSPLAVSTYTTHRSLPADVRPALPTAADLADALRDVRHPHNPQTPLTGPEPDG